MSCLFCKNKTPPPGARCRTCGRSGVVVRHTCHATGCNVDVAPRLLMCSRHWRLVPQPIQKKVWAAYVPGQEIRKDPTREYLDVMREAIRAVAVKEGRIRE